MVEVRQMIHDLLELAVNPPNNIKSDPRFKVARQYLKPKKQKPLSRATRWTSAASDAVAALEDLKAVQEEFEEWKDNLPENLQNSALGEKLEEVCGFDIDGALSTAQDAEGADLPQGFGRD